MRTYCKNRQITKQDVVDAISCWSQKGSGKKNFWRIEKEYGSIDSIVDEICFEIENRSLRFRPIRRYQAVE